MATLLQKNLAQNIVKAARSKKKVLKRDLLVSAGYGLTTAEATPSRIIEQKGVQQELKSLGFSEENAKRVVREILDDKYSEDKDRLKAAELVFKVFGTFAAEKQMNLNVSATAEEVTNAIKDTIKRFRGSE